MKLRIASWNIQMFNPQKAANPWIPNVLYEAGCLVQEPWILFIFECSEKNADAVKKALSKHLSSYSKNLRINYTKCHGKFQNGEVIFYVCPNSIKVSPSKQDISKNLKSFLNQKNINGLHHCISYLTNLYRTSRRYKSDYLNALDFLYISYEDYIKDDSKLQSQFEEILEEFQNNEAPESSRLPINYSFGAKKIIPEKAKSIAVKAFEKYNNYAKIDVSNLDFRSPVFFKLEWTFNRIKRKINIAALHAPGPYYMSKELFAEVYTKIDPKNEIDLYVGDFNLHEEINGFLQTPRNQWLDVSFNVYDYISAGKKYKLPLGSTLNRHGIFGSHRWDKILVNNNIPNEKKVRIENIGMYPNLDTDVRSVMDFRDLSDHVCLFGEVIFPIQDKFLLSSSSTYASSSALGHSTVFAASSATSRRGSKRRWGVDNAMKT